MFFNKVKSIVARCVAPLWLLVSRLRFWFTCRKFKPQTQLFIIDIDNTIADTWPTLLRPHFYQNTKERHQSLAIFMGMRKWILQQAKQPNTHFVYLSARPIGLMLTTINWLQSSGLPTIKGGVILVPNASAKIQFLKIANAQKISITFVDDLSFNHENGEVRLYQGVIELVKLLPIRYIGLPQLNEIQQLKHDY